MIIIFKSNIEIGMEFGKLTVIKELKKYKNNRTYYLCRCDCGAEKEVSTSQLTSGKSKSCGCLHFSNGEEYIKQVLDDNNIEYIRQKNLKTAKTLDHYHLIFICQNTIQLSNLMDNNILNQLNIGEEIKSLNI